MTDAIASRLALQGMLKQFLHTEGKYQMENRIYMRIETAINDNDKSIYKR